VKIQSKQIKIIFFIPKFDKNLGYYMLPIELDDAIAELDSPRQWCGANEAFCAT
jgi:hypothetical protein